MFGDRRPGAYLQDATLCWLSVAPSLKAPRPWPRGCLLPLAALPQFRPTCWPPSESAGRLGGAGTPRDGAALKAVGQLPRRCPRNCRGRSGQVKAQRAGLVKTALGRFRLQPPRPFSDSRANSPRRKCGTGQVISYGITLHGFTNPAAAGSCCAPPRITVSAARSWAAIKSFSMRRCLTSTATQSG